MKRINSNIFQFSKRLISNPKTKRLSRKKKKKNYTRIAYYLYTKTSNKISIPDHLCSSPRRTKLKGEKIKGKK